MIREMVRDFAETVLAPTVEHRDKHQIPPSEAWESFMEFGLQSITIPEEYGGAPVDDVSEAIIIEELARVDPFIRSNVLCPCRFVLNDHRPPRR
jgi:alkylation response protein AidB-like acyl-CoA dehydrogenase